MFGLIAFFFIGVCNAVVGVVVGLEIGDYPNITDTNQCGIGRQSYLMNDRCFRLHTISNFMTSSSIINGRDAKRAELPYIVYIEEWIDNKTSNRCTGTVLNQHWILTAAHCFDYCDSCLYKVYAGIIDIRYPGIDYGIKQLIVHQNYNKYIQSHYDIALINVKTPMNFSSNNGYYRQINGICLPTIDQNNTDYEYAVIAGFGRTKGHGLRDQLQMGWIRINPIDPNDPNVLYAVTYPEPPFTGSLVCNGDSGGPLIQYTNGRAVPIGVTVRTIIKFGLCVTYESVRMDFIRVATKINWIIDKIKNN